MENYRILMVDDDQDILWICQMVLSDEGFSIDISNDPRDALQKTMSKGYHIFILDYVMPYILGDELAKEILSINNDAVFIFLTGHNEFYDISKSLDCNSYLILLKPVDEQQLLKAVNEKVEYLKYLDETRELEKNQLDYAPLLFEDTNITNI
ncbi:MAG: response regulator [Candidatus Bathyarchaeota archaeon]|nr:response regulator [Candidatus Bathyarchaeota archaeon]